MPILNLLSQWAFKEILFELCVVCFSNQPLFLSYRKSVTQPVSHLDSWTGCKVLLHFVLRNVVVDIQHLCSRTAVIYWEPHLLPGSRSSSAEQPCNYSGGSEQQPANDFSSTGELGVEDAFPKDSSKRSLVLGFCAGYLALRFQS